MYCPDLCSVPITHDLCSPGVSGGLSQRREDGKIGSKSTLCATAKHEKPPITTRMVVISLFIIVPFPEKNRQVEVFISVH